MRLIHLTDPHLSTLEGQSIRALRGKRRSGYLSWTHKRQQIHRRETLEYLTAAIQAECADQLILSGDLVQIGLEEEIQEVSRWLVDLAPPQQIFFVPGNHDVYARDSWAALRRHWNFVLPAPAEGTTDSPTAGYPCTRDLGTVRLIGVSSACVTPVFSARGALGRDQLDRLDQLLRETRDLGQMPCIAIHHPPLPRMSIWRKALKENLALKKLITAQQPALVLCGHLHRNVEVLTDATRVFCTASASSIHNASFRIFDIDSFQGSGHKGWAIRMQLKSIIKEGAGLTVAEDERWKFTL